ncbi:MAG: aminotransferase class III-fold pyridoxal phosphate-dependent enzyme, partial [Ornithinimicrobium sp.]|uniref:aminotransferase class III-fold pyridoxal phosphate-dependent enzyme n=1 Tax=Ornithinimicrobium sp. TaxID=1977084 RepID=UPI003D9ABA49
MTDVDLDLPALEQRRLLRTQVPGPRSRELQSRRDTAVPPGMGTVLPIWVERADGGIVRDVDGNQLIDLGSGIAVTSVGASAPQVVSRVQEQAERFTHTCFMVTEYDSYLEVAERLNALTPGTHPKRTALFTTGSEAIENAVKIARYATGRSEVVVFDHAYHGRTMLTMAMTAKDMPYKHGFGPFPDHVHRAPYAYPLRWPTGPEHCAQEALAALEELLATIGPDTVAAVVVEPVQGEGGFVVPDLVCSAKALGGGLPLSAVTGRTELMDAVHPGGIGGTYAGNPLACAAALGVLDMLEDGELLGAARRIEQSVRDVLEPLAQE